MLFDDFFNIGIFLGYSILQLLECGVAAIITPMEKLQDFLSRKIANSKRGEHVSQQENMDSQNEFVIDENDSNVIETDLEPVVENYIDNESKFRAIDEQIREMKARIERYEKQGLPK